MSGRSAKQNRRMLRQAQIAAEVATRRTKLRLWLGGVMTALLLGAASIVLLFVHTFPGLASLSP